MYVELVQLAERPGALELAQVASTEHQAIVAADLMEATLRGGDRAAWSTEALAEADAALARIVDAVNQADGLIDGYLRQRRYALPLFPVPRLVAEWSRAIARYYLHRNSITDERSDPIARDYRDALRQLQQVVDGKLSLGPEDPQAPKTEGVQISAAERVWDRNTLRDF